MRMTLDRYEIAELTPGVLTRMLSAQPGWESLTITSAVGSPVGTGQMAHSYRVELTYSDRPDDAPGSIVAKLPSTDPASRQMGMATGAYQREVLFYRHLGGLTGVRAPHCYHADIAENGCDFVLLLEDVGPATSVDQLAGCSPDQAELALSQAAALHGGSWQHPALVAQAWLPVQQVWGALAGAIPQAIGPWLERFGHFLEPEHVGAVQQLSGSVTAWLSTLAQHRSLWHGDFRLDNLLFDARAGAIPIGVVDWQSTAVGPGVIDVSYFLGNSLSETDRAAHERTLVDDYHRRLLTLGVSGYDREQCWREYQAHALYGLILTIPVSLGVVSTERGDAMFGAMARRAAQQIVDNDSFSALDILTR